ncbi:amino acid ABC transporter substrate-binding protein [Methanoplanus sp. FWC-SCC4]|uniref:Amino acid ABC transporter substrate-binding protein n=1 Tax=Methanochimaera problematica TaxID=2609417 RepID=A0AA97FCN8_9EURY|nr:ABC transporter substrate-binding protein [Methanoplanus sp. FWC-SCC4]WOF17050.1 amino acid ABC transporter substrate-binding protein [Methanoplanus sp. FWC-SCC4]
MDRRILSVVLIIMAVLAVATTGCTSEAPEQKTSEDSIKISPDQTPAAPGEKVIYKVGVDIPYQPFSMLDDEGNPTGFDVESIEWIAEDQGFSVEFKTIAWDGAIPALQSGSIDIIISGMTITPERAEKINFSTPYWTVNQAVIAMDDSDATVDELMAGELTIGTHRGCTAAIWIDQNLVETGIMPEENLKLYDNPPLAVADLINGRVDTVMYDSTVIYDIIEGKPVKKIGLVETNEQFGIAVRKSDPELLEKINTGLENLMESPKWDEMIEKYRMK